MTTSSTTSTRRRDAREALAQAASLAPVSLPGRAVGASMSIVPLERRGSGVGRERILEQALQILAAATPWDDANLAQTCRGVLDALQDAGPAGGGSGGGVSGTSLKPLPPPGWARRSIPEDGGLVHETVSPVHPLAKVGGVNGWQLVPTDVSLSATDLLIDGRWIRTEPTIQVEGASYSLDGAQNLRDALDHFLDAAALRPSTSAAP